MRSCLVCFFCFQLTFVEVKATKTFSEVKSCVFSSPDSKGVGKWIVGFWVKMLEKLTKYAEFMDGTDYRWLILVIDHSETTHTNY